MRSPTPRLPLPYGQLSPWQFSVMDDPLTAHGKHDDLPAQAEVAVIGGGLCGVLTAYHLATAPNPPASIILLEARDICSGASGRNAGHCRPDAFRSYPRYKGTYGEEMALQLMASEAEVLRRVAAFIRKHDIDCEFQFRDTLEVSLDAAYSRACQDSLRDLAHDRRAAGPASELDAAVRAAVTLVDGADAAFRWPAASLNPAKLCLGLVRLCLDRGVQVFSHAPVHAIAAAPAGWTVTTSRGTVVAEKIVHATNGYASALLPELDGVVVPTRSQAHRLARDDVANAALPELEHSYSLRYSAAHFYSLIQRPDRTLVLGTSRGWPGAPPAVMAETVDTVNDQTFSPELAANTVDVFTKLFAPASGRPFKLESAWTGIIGLTPDHLPLVGAVPGKPGQFIAAGYNGHGMARIFLCAPGLAQLVCGSAWEATGMPRCFAVTEERLGAWQS